MSKNKHWKRRRPVVAMTISVEGLLALNKYAQSHGLTRGQAIEHLLDVRPEATGRITKFRVADAVEGPSLR